jgi:hypothetical protein
LLDGWKQTFNANHTVAKFENWPRLAVQVAADIGHFLGQRPAEVTWRDLHVADSLVADAEIILPPGVARIGLRQAASDCEAVAVGGQRPGEVASGDLGRRGRFTWR